MKKLVTIGLVICLVLGVCACGGSANEAIEETVRETETERATVAVELTLDNWEEYFELKSVWIYQEDNPYADSRENARRRFGNELNVPYAQEEYWDDYVGVHCQVFALKDEYLNRLDFENSACDIIGTYDTNLHHVVLTEDNNLEVGEEFQPGSGCYDTPLREIPPFGDCYGFGIESLVDEWIVFGIGNNFVNDGFQGYGMVGTYELGYYVNTRNLEYIEIIDEINIESIEGYLYFYE